jgi:hypothetical protein
MKVPFELEWMGGAAAHHFRKARPGADDHPWGTVDVSQYAPAAVEEARASWTEVATFSEVLRALVDVKAPLDLLGMTSDFLADEVAHVELASRMAMELGGGAPRIVDFDRFTSKPRGRTAWQRANDIVLRMSCVAEAFSGGTAHASYEATSHPLPRGLYESILRDEAHHRRLGALYFEWALSRIDETELQRLGRVLLESLRALSPFWKSKSARSKAPPWPEADLRALGWLSRPRFASIAREVVVRDILDPLETIGIAIAPEERAELLA